MQLVSEVKTVHIELTDKCQAQCPMCARNYHGGATREFIKNNDISLEQFKQWFPREFLTQLSNFYSCGNYGDPVFAKDCLEIFEYVRQCNTTTKIAIHTNGGMRDSKWWSKLAQVMGDNSEVVFAVDGLAGKHELYRKNTKFEKVIENLKSFIEAGGNARVESLVFKHNENDIDELDSFLKSLGVTHVNFFSTQRFYDMKKFEVYNKDDSLVYYLEPAQTDKFKKKPFLGLNNLVDEEIRQAVLSASVISPKCQNEIYVDPVGNIFPCCWIGGEYIEQPIKELLPIHYLRNLSVEFTKKMLDDIGIENCNNKVLYNNNTLFTGLDKYWQGKDKCMTCARQCSDMIYDLKSKYD